MIPKRAVDVMSCEINRLLVLSQNAIVPVAFHVQKKVNIICLLNKIVFLVILRVS